MEIRCLHCGQPLQIEPAQLGQSLSCPHCARTIALPAAAMQEDGAAVPARVNWLANSLSTLASMLFHAVLLLIFALISYGEVGVPNEGEEVMIGTLPEVLLEEDEPAELTTESQETPEQAAEMSMSLQIEAPSSLASDGPSALGSLELSPSAAGAAGGEFDLGVVGVGGSMAGGGSWEGMLQNLRRNGLDIVIAFDSTSSMRGEIEQVKSQIERIGKTLLKLVPKARVSLCTYRDVNDTYVVRGIPLSNQVEKMREFLYGVQAAGGGDTPEAVDQGLNWAIVNNDFRTRARKVILIFGDAPPHADKLADCLRMASDFSRQHDGVVSTVTCRRNSALPEFRQIAQTGGGESFLTTDERQIVTQLMVLVFGARHRAKVLEAFK